MKFFDILTLILLIIGGLNWGLIAVNDMDVVAMFLGKATGAARLVYGLVGLSAVYRLIFWKCICHRCH
jgi:uncharacterized protein